MKTIKTSIPHQNPIKLTLQYNRKHKYDDGGTEDAFWWWEIYTNYFLWSKGKMCRLENCLGWGYAPSKNKAIDEAQISVAGFLNKFVNASVRRSVFRNKREKKRMLKKILSEPTHD